MTPGCYASCCSRSGSLQTLLCKLCSLAGLRPLPGASVAAEGLCPFDHSPVERVVPEGGAVSDDEGVHLRPGEGDVHPPQVGEEAEPPLRVAPDAAHEHRLRLATLEGVHGV